MTELDELLALKPGAIICITTQEIGVSEKKIVLKSDSADYKQLIPADQEYVGFFNKLIDGKIKINRQSVDNVKLLRFGIGNISNTDKSYLASFIGDPLTSTYEIPVEAIGSLKVYRKINSTESQLTE